MNHSLSRPYEPNFMSIVPCWRLPGTKTPLRESSNVMQLFHACSANFTLGTMKGSNLFSQKRREGWGRSMVNIQIYSETHFFWLNMRKASTFLWQALKKADQAFSPVGSQIFSPGPKFFSLQVPFSLAGSQSFLSPGPKLFSLRVPNFSLPGSQFFSRAQIEDGNVPGPRQLPLGPPSCFAAFFAAAWLNMIYLRLSHSTGFIAQRATGNSENI